MSTIQKFLVKLESSGFLKVTYPNLDLLFLNEQSPLIDSRAFHLFRLIHSIEKQYNPLLPHLLPTLLNSLSYVDFRRKIVSIYDLNHSSARQFLMDFDALLLQIYFSSPEVIALFLPPHTLLSQYISNSSQLDQELYNSLLSGS